MPLNLQDITLQPADPQRHFAAIAALMSSEETEPTTPASLAEWYNKRQDEGITLTLALDRAGELVGFHGLYRANTNLDRYYGMYLMVSESSRCQGLGTLLYDHLLEQAIESNVRTLRARVRDNDQPSHTFALHRGFSLKYHSIEMMLDLTSWDDTPYDPSLQALQSQGFRFTTMAEQGDTPEARRKLYALNNSAAATDPGSNGIPPWSTFEEFERDVCNSSWYHPDAQIVAIDTHTGDWAAMSAITVFEGADHAYNLFTGTDMCYRGRKLAQAVKTLALRRAREFGVGKVRTSHTSKNDAMIAIDIKLGYVHTPGTLVMEKDLEHA